MDPVIDYEQAGEFIRCKSDLRLACIRNRFFLPELRDPINTRYFLEGILTGHYWCFHSDDVQGLIPVADPPSKEDLSNLLHARMH